MAQVQYNLQDFANREAYIRVAKPQRTAVKKRRKLNFAYLQIAAVCVIGIALVTSVLYAHMQLNEITAQIAKAQDQLVELNSEYDYLNNQLESRMSISNVEQYASQTLGLIKFSSTQIEYITLREENHVVVLQQGTPFTQKVAQMWAALLEYIVP